MIHILTVTHNRPLYLNRCIKSILHNNKDFQDVHHHIVFNGCSVESIDPIHPSYNVTFYQHNSFETLEFNLNKYLPLMGAEDDDIVVKFDDDVIVSSPDFFNHVKCIMSLIPNAVISPFPVGLINNLGGPASNDRQVIYGKDTDTFYTLRKVNHVGGFARITRYKNYKNFMFTSVNGEDVNFSNTHKHLEFFYLENSLIVEHCESTLGQHARFDNTYFKGRF